MLVIIPLTRVFPGREAIAQAPDRGNDMLQLG